MKNSMTILLWLITSLSIFSNNYYYFDNINNDISNEAISHICEDSNGLVWFGGISGLYYHNNQTIKRIELNKATNTPENIKKIYKDSHQSLWICTDNGLYKQNKEVNKFEHKRLYQKQSEDPITNDDIENIIQLNENEYIIHIRSKLYKYDEGDSSLQAIKPVRGPIYFLHQDENGLIYIGAQNNKIYLSKDNLQHTTLLYNSSKGRISSICKDGNKYYVGYINDGIEIINPNGAKITELNHKLKGDNHLADNHIRQIIRRKNGEIWAASHLGIIVFKDNKQLLLDSKPEIGLPHRTVFALHKGSNNSVWVGTYAGGLAYYSDYNYVFKYVPIGYERLKYIKSDVSSFCEDARGYIWIGSEDEGGLSIYNPKNDTFEEELPQPFKDKTKGIKTLACINDEIIAIGKLFSNQLILYNYKKHRAEASIDLPLNPTPGILSIVHFEDKLWIKDRLNVVSYNLQNQEIKTAFKSQSPISQLYFDSSHNLWISTIKGLYVKKPDSDTITKSQFGKTIEQLSDPYIYAVCEDKNGLLWVGTLGKGLYTYSDENETTHLAPDHILTAESDIYNIIKDKENNIWYTTNNGIYRYNTYQKETRSYDTTDGLSQITSKPNATLCSDNGDIYLGSRNGFNIITPQNIKDNPIAPRLYLASLQINNQPYALPLQNEEPRQDITLNDEQNTLSFQLTSTNFIKKNKNRFKYRLKNYDDNWIETTSNKSNIFTKVPPGNYTFEALGSNNDTVWSKSPLQLNITIRAPYYKRWYAFLIYALILSAIAYSIYHELDAKLKLKKTIAKERYQAQANELVHSERIKLYTNIAHELRTPLSLVISPIRNLLERGTLNNEDLNLLRVAERNTNRLIKIADQSLDYRLMEMGKLEAVFKQHDIIQLSQTIYLCFEEEIKDRRLQSTFLSDYKHLEVYIDGDMIEKTIFNLLSNAIKYSPQSAHISLQITKQNLTESNYDSFIVAGEKFLGDAISLIIQDTGLGIKADILPHIFERFTKGINNHQNSSGIGLHMCKEYARINHSNIVLHTIEGEGSSFTLNIPFVPQENYKEKKEKQILQYRATEQQETEEVKENNEHKRSILVIENNVELRQYMKKFLSDNYHIITTKNAEETLDLLASTQPDLIISDVAMSGMSGIELTKKLKNNATTKHIPIIILTAHIERAIQMECLTNGADAFLPKPIDEQMLIAQINNILSKKEQAKKSSSFEDEKSKISPKEFTQQAEDMIIENIQNADFGIKELITALNTSKTTLTRKIKSETQYNPSAFIRNIRLKKATELIRSTNFHIEDIATYVGFNSTSYFIRTFKNKFGITPKEYRLKYNSKKTVE